MTTPITRTPIPPYRESYEIVDGSKPISGLGDIMGGEEELMQRANSELATITQTLINMLIYMSQGGNFTRGDKAAE